MKTLIIYGTKHGAAEKCSKLLKDKLRGEIVTIDIKTSNIPDITSFDNIIIGGSIYMGQIQKGIKRFCIKNLNVLKNKRVGLFICGMNDTNIDTQINSSFPEELSTNAITKEYFGGEVIFNKMNFFEKIVMKKVAKTDKDVSKILKENIIKFAELIG